MKYNHQRHVERPQLKWLLLNILAKTFSEAKADFLLIGIESSLIRKAMATRINSWWPFII
jgi:hypothetical protein